MDMADRGLALPDGSYPIKDEADLKNAIQSYGRAKDKERAKAHIIKRARALGLDDLIPEDWMQTDDTKGMPSTMGSAAGSSMTPEKFRRMRMAMMDDAENAAETAAPDEEMEPKKPMRRVMNGAANMMGDAEDAAEEAAPDEEMPEESPKKKAVVKIGTDGEMMSCAKGLEGGECGYKMGSKVCGKCGAMAVQVKKPMMAEEMGQDAEDEMMDEEKQKFAWHEDLRFKRLDSLGISPETTDVFVCANDRKMYQLDSDVCRDCRGGCAPEGNLPGLLEVEGLAEQAIGGKVLQSGYSDATDLFLVIMQRKDGKIVESMFDGEGTMHGWHLLDEEVLSGYGVKSAEGQEFTAVTIAEATDIALAYAGLADSSDHLSMTDAKAVAVDADLFEGYDAYAIEVKDAQGKSADIYVSIDGVVLGHDEYEAGSSVAVKSVDADELVASLAEFEILATESELRDEGLL